MRRYDAWHITWAGSDQVRVMGICKRDGMLWVKYKTWLFDRGPVKVPCTEVHV